MPLSSQGEQAVKSVLDGSVKDGSPGLVFSAVDKSGHVLVQHAAGTVGVDSSEPMDIDSTIFWIASCTKLVTAIAVLQLVEQGKIPLDDPDFVKKIAPEIGDKKVYADGVTPADKQKEVTMRMLLSHTAGFGYSFFDPRVQFEGPLEGAGGDKNDIINSLLVNQPGIMWEYGINMDWAGIILERVTGQTTSPSTSSIPWTSRPLAYPCFPRKTHRRISRTCTSATARANYQSASTCTPEP
jgi:CubicO group peptidase (beta-lactamase class C family)